MQFLRKLHYGGTIIPVGGATRIQEARGCSLTASGLSFETMPQESLETQIVVKKREVK